jgi:hypothetical protein
LSIYIDNALTLLAPHGGSFECAALFSDPAIQLCLAIEFFSEEAVKASDQGGGGLVGDSDPGQRGAGIHDP